VTPISSGTCRPKTPSNTYASWDPDSDVATAPMARYDLFQPVIEKIDRYVIGCVAIT
jgi:hypothetical protein